jgi:four helix bundle protein
MNSDDLKTRTKKFALSIIELAAKLPNTAAGKVISYQMIKAGSSIGANYRAACRGRSKAEFNSKLHIVLEEADESVFWLELIVESDILPLEEIKELLNEANELTAIFAKSFYTAKRRI